MITKTYMTIIDQVRSHKEAVAARHDFDVVRIIAAARERQESSGHRVIRQGEQGGQNAAEQAATRPSRNDSGLDP